MDSIMYAKMAKNRCFRLLHPCQAEINLTPVNFLLLFARLLEPETALKRQSPRGRGIKRPVGRLKPGRQDLCLLDLVLRRAGKGRNEINNLAELRIRNS